MSSVPEQRGACADLPIEVVDAYWDCNANTERFRASVARAICHRCPQLIDCLEAAIANPPANGIRAGETGSALYDMHCAVYRGETTVDALVDECLDRQMPIGGLREAARLRRGLMPDAVLAVPELGGAA
jgi:hypothetical protein